MAFSGKRKHDVFVAFADRTVRCYDAQTAQLLATLKGHHTPCYSIAAHPTDDSLVTCSSDSVLMWDTQVRAHGHPPPPASSPSRTCPREFLSSWCVQQRPYVRRVPSARGLPLTRRS
jgi:WD40 repeat protein